MDKRTSHTLEVRSHPGNDDIQEVFLDGKPLGQLTHDAGGWGGMEEARALLESLAKRLGWRYDEQL